jgi:hypothetical protein
MRKLSLLVLAAKLSASVNVNRSKLLKSISDLLRRQSVVDVMDVTDLAAVEAVDVAVGMAREVEAKDLSAEAVVTGQEVAGVAVVTVAIVVLPEADHEVVGPALQSTRRIPMLSQALVHRTLRGQPYISLPLVGKLIESGWRFAEGSKLVQQFRSYVEKKIFEGGNLWIVL